MVELHTEFCSFCGKSQHEVRKLIAGPTVFICSECVWMCNEIIVGEIPREMLPADIGLRIRLEIAS